MLLCFLDVKIKLWFTAFTSTHKLILVFAVLINVAIFAPLFFLQHLALCLFSCPSSLLCFHLCLLQPFSFLISALWVTKVGRCWCLGRQAAPGAPALLPSSPDFLGNDPLLWVLGYAGTCALSSCPTNVLVQWPACTRWDGTSAGFGVSSSLFPCWPHADTEYEYFDAGRYESCLLHTVLIKDLKMEHWGSE